MRCKSSHSTLTFSEALCSSMSSAHAPESRVLPPSLRAVKGPSRLLASELYRKMTEPILTLAVGMVSLSAQE